MSQAFADYLGVNARLEEQDRARMAYENACSRYDGVKKSALQVLGNLSEDELRALVVNGATSEREIGTPLRDVKALAPS
jgi:hypothetical protein